MRKATSLLENHSGLYACLAQIWILYLQFISPGEQGGGGGGRRHSPSVPARARYPVLQTNKSTAEGRKKNDERRARSYWLRAM